MAIKHSEDFKQEAVRIALTSGLPRARVASDLGVGKSTLGKWVSDYRPTDMVLAPSADLAPYQRCPARSGSSIRSMLRTMWAAFTPQPMPMRLSMPQWMRAMRSTPRLLRPPNN
jgi:transposase